MSGPVETAREHWGADMPDWVSLLAAQCAKSSQNKVAKRLNRSAALVSAVLRNRYEGDMGAVEEVVRGVFELATVSCPAQGELQTNICRDFQLAARKYSDINSEMIRMYRACNSCPRYRAEGTLIHASSSFSVIWG
ncbi:hypothetical protein PUH89_12855 [Rhodobacter capsulatus]|uniref:Transcriptional regulator n=1 Tax=Rhodobacter capsulatus TaxID=1061 RepID=A0A1G7NA47_RHOCA|nr:hypothetical protein [Rhodobacter capsulatus]WER08209.1 hypothetical protein PUH89_12855 [Rhodobacter capsulatus]SDF70816.1 hypothetical protein SAMN04244550_02705 [Rhodobacter capsulatus]